jgi:SAM-dependent methyltransferase
VIDYSLPTCPVCASMDTKLEYTVQGYAHHRCLDCGAVYVFPVPSPNELAEIYQNRSYYSKARPKQGGVVPHVDRRLRYIENMVERPGSLLDIGCADGYFMLAARKRGWRTVGIEQSSHTARFGREEYNLEIINSSLERANLTSVAFDVVTLWGVIEHVPQPTAFLQKATQLLKPDGLLCLVTNSTDGWMGRLMRDKFPFLIPPEHLCLFPVQTLRRIFNQLNMQIVRIETYDVVTPDKAVRGLGKLLSLDWDYGRHPVVDAVAYMMSGIIQPLLWILGKVNLGSEVEVYARKHK